MVEIEKFAAENVGDKEVSSLFDGLRTRALVPFSRIMEKVLCEGSLDDPYNEFFLKESTPSRMDGDVNLSPVLHIGSVVVNF